MMKEGSQRAQSGKKAEIVMKIDADAWEKGDVVTVSNESGGSQQLNSRGKVVLVKMDKYCGARDAKCAMRMAMRRTGM
jgi:hypothetical protein